MKSSLENSHDKLLESFIGFLSRQWTSLGVPGNRAVAGDLLIDPEALFLITTKVGRYDSRLMDLSIDWLHAHGKLINLQRLGRLRGMWPISDDPVFRATAVILAEQSSLRKWRNPGGGRDICVLPEKDEPLFHGREGKPVPFFGEPDPRFARFRLLRSEWKPRGECRLPSPDRAPNLVLVLRALFGMNARAEIMAWLLTHESGHPAAIARATGYFSKSIQTTLNEMEASGQIRSSRDGREKNYWLNRADWRFLIKWQEPEGFPRWINWPPVYYFAMRTLQLLKKDSDPNASEHLRAIQQRAFLDEITPKLAGSPIRSEMKADRQLKGTELTAAIEKDVAMLSRLMEEDFREWG